MRALHFYPDPFRILSTATLRTQEVENFGLHEQAKPLSVLDLGAGWGRITRLMMRDVAPENLAAVDVDERLVSAGKSCLVDLTFRKIEAGEPLPFENERFSLVLANSVLSHLDENLHRFTVGEVSRLLRPGGVFLGTTLSERHYLNYLSNEGQRKWLSGIIGDLDEGLERLRAGEFVYGYSGRWEGYGMAFLPDGWVTKNWSNDLEVQKTRLDYSQDVQVAQKPI